MRFLLFMLRFSLLGAAICFGAVAGAHFDAHRETACIAGALSLVLVLVFTSTFIEKR